MFSKYGCTGGLILALQFAPKSPFYVSGTCSKKIKTDSWYIWIKYISLAYSYYFYMYVEVFIVSAFMLIFLLKVEGEEKGKGSHVGFADF